MGKVDPKEILNTKLFDFEKASQAPGWAKELAGIHLPETEEYGIESFVMRAREPLHPTRFMEFLEYPFAGVIRAKGYVWVASRPEWVVAYSRAGNKATIEPVGQWWANAPKDRLPPIGTPERKSIDDRWKEPYGDRINELVFIGHKMDRAAVEAAFKRCQLNFTETRKGMKAWRELPDALPSWARKELVAAE